MSDYLHTFTFKITFPNASVGAHQKGETVDLISQHFRLFYWNIVYA